LDETPLSNGKLYTILTHKEAQGKKGSIITIVKGTQASGIINVHHKISIEKRDIVK
jgi:hypothetical protein